MISRKKYTYPAGYTNDWKNGIRERENGTITTTVNQRLTNITASII
ncbi:hypothetical protein [Chitinophaga eiseniae]|uniref:Transposase n=1 Tax=Chitinophaga eiseniae TaxID=634771 RepID=A0A847SWF1_9BACT|nr:hypothetical protein [Chitinophaga eiseniae]NLR82726.1 hypothetical protein [Chitinophaga eiseniae]